VTDRYRGPVEPGHYEPPAAPWMRISHRLAVAVSAAAITALIGPSGLAVFGLGVFVGVIGALVS
jgi:hypothetical protein